MHPRETEQFVVVSKPIIASSSQPRVYDVDQAVWKRILDSSLKPKPTLYFVDHTSSLKFKPTLQSNDFFATLR